MKSCYKLFIYISNIDRRKVTGCEYFKSVLKFSNDHLFVRKEIDVSNCLLSLYSFDGVYVVKLLLRFPASFHVYLKDKI